MQLSVVHSSCIDRRHLGVEYGTLNSPPGSQIYGVLLVNWDRLSCPDYGPSPVGDFLSDATAWIPRVLKNTPVRHVWRRAGCRVLAAVHQWPLLSRLECVPHAPGRTAVPRRFRVERKRHGGCHPSCVAARRLRRVPARRRTGRFLRSRWPETPRRSNQGGFGVGFELLSRS